MLDRDMSLGYESISLVNGHAGSEISFVAETRELVISSWCMREIKELLPFGKKKYNETKSESRYPLPPEIDSGEELMGSIKLICSLAVPKA